MRPDVPLATDRTTARTGWLAGLLIGVVDGVAVLYLGFAGVVLAAVGLAGIVLQGPRLPAMAGLALGIGITWSMAFGNASNMLRELAGAAVASLLVGTVSTLLLAVRSRPS